MAHLQESPGTTTIDWTACPDVEINPEKLGGTPILKHSRMPADGIVANYADGMSAAEIAEVSSYPRKAYAICWTTPRPVTPCSSYQPELRLQLLGCSLLWLVSHPHPTHV